jgi:hypothetical protein
MREAIRFSHKLSGALVIELKSVEDDQYEAVRDDGGLVVPAIEQGVGNWLIDDAYLADVQRFIASIKGRRPPVYVRFENGEMVEAPKDGSREHDDEPGGPKP